MKRPCLTVLVPVLFTLAIGCSSDGPSLGKRLADRLQACEVFTPGKLTWYEPETRGERCYFECLIGADCPTLRSEMCVEPQDMGTTPCALACPYQCKNGDTAIYNAHCNGIDDCTDASDEEGCDHIWFNCSETERIPVQLRCDGLAQCESGADELNCPTYTCASGEVLPQAFRCDGTPDCEGGTDEEGCPTFQCQDGSTIPARWECDQHVDCPDESDESHCSVMVCE